MRLFEILAGGQDEDVALKVVTLAEFEQGLAFYEERQFAAAANAFTQVLALHPGDVAAQIYLKRANQQTGQELPADWDGVEVIPVK